MITAAPAKSFARFRKLVRIGVAFELVLIALSVCLRETAFGVHIGNFLLLTHYPVLMAIMYFGFGEGFLGAVLWTILCGLIGLLMFGAVWGLCFYLVSRLCIRVLAWLGLRTEQKLVLKGGLAALCIVVLVWLGISALGARQVQFTASPEVRSTVDANTAFALELYNRLKEQPGNLFFSPFSISTALAMTYAGARGQTATEMAETLHFNLPAENQHAAFGVLVERMKNIQRHGRITLAIASSLWCQHDYKFTDEFLRLIRKYYGGEARQVDFRHAPETAAREINDWVSSKTKRKIKAMVEPSQFTTDSRLVLCNAIYFKGKWLHQFKPKDTKPAPFHVGPEKTVLVPMMYQSSDFKVAYTDDDVQLLELPYAGNAVSMVILLPEIGDEAGDIHQPPLLDLERKLTLTNLRAWLEKLDRDSPGKTAVWLPKFVVTHSSNLSDELKALGMASAFGPSADFSGMDGTTNLFVSDVVHMAHVEVEETGTTATAVSVSFMPAKSMANQFRVDRPFIFLIRDNGSGTILFLGRVVDPTQQ